MPTSREGWLTTAEVARLTGKPVGTVNRWVREGKLKPADQYPGRTGPRRFRRRDIEPLLPTATEGKA
jgi:excisionase family DNA binding protein